LHESPNSFEPEVLANIEPEKLAHYFSDHCGPIPWPNFETRLSMTREYAQWFVKRHVTPQDLLNYANSEKFSLKTFLDYTTGLPGYNQDPLWKRNYLLAMVLANRPEQFLKVNDPENWHPIVDYHLMRLSLRLGIVEVDNCVGEWLSDRKWIDPGTEEKIRTATFEAVEKLIEESGKPMSFVDFIMWSARKYCPEMTEPDCAKCMFNDVCAKRTKLFQPVIRTTAY
jgi:hypothetical protein